MLLTLIVLHRTNGSRIGMILVAISQADALAESIGVNIMTPQVTLLQETRLRTRATVDGMQEVVKFKEMRSESQL